MAAFNEDTSGEPKQQRPNEYDRLSAVALPDEPEVVAWECTDLIMGGEPGVITDVDHAAMRKLQPNAWSVEELVRRSQAHSTIAALRAEVEHWRGEARRLLKSGQEALDAAETAEAEVKRLTEDNEALRAERDAAFEMSRCECGPEEACRNLAIDKARINALEEAGNSLSNVVFNLSQLSSPLTDEQKASMRQWVDAWDAATLNSREQER